MCPGVILLDHMATLFLVFWGNSILFSIVKHAILLMKPWGSTEWGLSRIICAWQACGWWCLGSTPSVELNCLGHTIAGRALLCLNLLRTLAATAWGIDSCSLQVPYLCVYVTNLCWGPAPCALDSCSNGRCNRVIFFLAYLLVPRS